MGTGLLAGVMKMFYIYCGAGCRALNGLKISDLYPLNSELHLNNCYQNPNPNKSKVKFLEAFFFFCCRLFSLVLVLFAGASRLY